MDASLGVGKAQQVEPRREHAGGHYHRLCPVVGAGQHRLPQGVHHCQRTEGGHVLQVQLCIAGVRIDHYTRQQRALHRIYYLLGQCNRDAAIFTLHLNRTPGGPIAFQPCRVGVGAIGQAYGGIALGIGGQALAVDLYDGWVEVAVAYPSR